MFGQHEFKESHQHTDAQPLMERRGEEEGKEEGGEGRGGEEGRRGRRGKEKKNQS